MRFQGRCKLWTANTLPSSWFSAAGSFAVRPAYSDLSFDSIFTLWLNWCTQCKIKHKTALNTDLWQISVPCSESTKISIAKTYISSKFALVVDLKNNSRARNRHDINRARSCSRIYMYTFQMEFMRSMLLSSWTAATLTSMLVCRESCNAEEAMKYVNPEEASLATTETQKKI